MVSDGEVATLGRSDDGSGISSLDSLREQLIEDEASLVSIKCQA